MYVRISEDTEINLEQVAKIVMSGEADKEYSYLFYGNTGFLLGQSEYGSPYNKDIEAVMNRARIR